MRLIDCFNDIFVYTLYLLQVVGDGEDTFTEDNMGWGSELPNGMLPSGVNAYKVPVSQEVPQTPENYPPPPQALKPQSEEDEAETDAEDVEAVAIDAEYSFEEVHDSFIRLFNNAHQLRLQSSFAQSDYEQAKFAVCAWVDEMISISEWPEKMKWASVELQRQFFQTTNAGEEFYSRLCQLKNIQTDVLEVYATCLNLGFKGCYYSKHAEKELLNLRRSVCSRFLGCSPEIQNTAMRQLFIQGYPTAIPGVISKKKEKTYKSLMAICCILMPLILFISMHLIYDNILENICTEILNSFL